MEKLNSRHFMILIWGTCIVSLKTYPHIFMKNGGRDTWIAIIISSLLIFLYTYFLLKISSKTGDYNITLIYEKAFGKLLSKVFLIFFLITIFFTLIESSSIESSSMHETLLLETPPWYILLIFLIATLYSVKKGLKPLIILSTIGIFFIIIAGTNLAFMTTKYKKIKYLFPIMEHGITAGFIISILKSLGLYGHFAILLCYFPIIKDKKLLLKDSLIGLFFVVQMEIISIIGIITTFDIDRSINIWYPKLMQTQLVSYFSFLESGELFVMLQIVGGWFIKYIISFYAIIMLLKSLNMYNKFLYYIITILIFICSFFSSKNVFFLFKALDIYAYICLINYIVIPLIAFTILIIKHKVNLKNNQIPQKS